MARFYSLFSGSKGNASLVSAGGGSLLLDAGVSCRQLLTSLTAHHIDPASIEGIFITHTHIDHIRGLQVLCKKLHTKIYGTDETIQTLLQNQYITESQVGALIPENGLALPHFTVQSFPTEHDAWGSCGYRIQTSDDRSCAVCTDLGVVTDPVHHALSGCDLVLLEANYDPGMLHCGRYPAYLKSRIAGRQGHLSNMDCAAEAQQLIQSGTTRLVLGHLSQENNTPQLARQTVQTHLAQKYQCGQDYLLYVAEPAGLKEMVIF